MLVRHPVSGSQRDTQGSLLYSAALSGTNNDVIYCFRDRTLIRFPDFRERFVTLVLLMVVAGYLNSL